MKMEQDIQLERKNHKRLRTESVNIANKQAEVENQNVNLFKYLYKNNMPESNNFNNNYHINININNNYPQNDTINSSHDLKFKKLYKRTHSLE